MRRYSHLSRTLCYLDWVSLPSALLNVPGGQSSGSSVPSGQYRPCGHTFASLPWLGVAEVAPEQIITNKFYIPVVSKKRLPDG